MRPSTLRPACPRATLTCRQRAAGTTSCCASRRSSATKPSTPAPTSAYPRELRALLIAHASAARWRLLSMVPDEQRRRLHIPPYRTPAKRRAYVAARPPRAAWRRGCHEALEGTPRRAVMMLPLQCACDEHAWAPRSYSRSAELRLSSKATPTGSNMRRAEFTVRYLYLYSRRCAR